MWTITPPSSAMRRASAPYSSGVYGIAGHWSRLASDPEIEQVMTTGSSRLKACPSAGSGKSYSPPCHRLGHWSRGRLEGLSFRIRSSGRGAFAARSAPPPLSHQGWFMLNRRLAAGALVAACAVAISACGVQFSSPPSAFQKNVIGDVVITTPICTTSGTGCSAPGWGVTSAQSVLAYRVPAGVDAPALVADNGAAYHQDAA